MVTTNHGFVTMPDVLYYVSLLNKKISEIFNMIIMELNTDVRLHLGKHVMNKISQDLLYMQVPTTMTGYIKSAFQTQFKFPSF